MHAMRGFGALQSERGIASVVAVAALPLLVTAVLSIVSLYRVLAARAAMQAAADRAALRAAAAQAEALNAVALLNDGIVGLELLAGGLFLVGNEGGGALDALVVTAPEGIELHQTTLEATERLREAAARLAEIQDRLVEALPYLPLAAAGVSTALADEGLVLPYPWPGVDGALTVEAPLEARSLGVANLSAILQRAARDKIDAAGKAGKQWRRGLRRMDEGGCRAVKAAAPKRLRTLAGRVCKAASKHGSTSLGSAFAASLNTSAASAGVTLPLPLAEDYAAHYQVGVIVGGIDRFAVAQARAVSAAQPRGGDLWVPDLAARLVPVRLPADAAALLNIAKEDTWRFWH